MGNDNTVIALFPDHQAAETAVKKLSAAGFSMESLSVAGEGCHTDEKAVGFFCNVGGRLKFWGKRSAFWGGVYGLFFGGLIIMRILTVAIVIGPVMVISAAAFASAG